MRRSQDLALVDIPAPGRSLSSNSRMSHDSARDISNQDPFSDQNSHQAEIHSSHPYDPSFVELLSNAKQQDTLYGSVFIDGWGWELAAWLLSAVSTVTLLTVFAIFANKSLHSWNSTITPAAVVAILSQFGQTAVLAPVTACICQSMWLWLHKESRARQPSIQVDKHPQLISMQQYDGGSRGPLGSLFLLFKNPGSYGNDFHLLYAAAYQYQDTGLAWNNRHFSDYLIWHFRSTDTSIAYTPIQSDRYSSHSEKPAVSSYSTCSAI